MINKPITTENKAKEYVKAWFRKRGIELTPPAKGEVGFDFKSLDGKKFIEAKGTTKTTSAEIGFRYLTNAEYEKAKECKRSKLDYEIHLITGVDGEAPKHYIIPAKDIIEKAKPEMSWFIPLRKGDFEKFKI